MLSRLRDVLFIYGTIVAVSVLVVLWTDYSYHRGVAAATEQCEYESSY